MEITEIIPKALKKFPKNNIMLIAGVGVAGIALFAFFNRKAGGEIQTEQPQASYASYPTTPEGVDTQEISDTVQNNLFAGLEQYANEMNNYTSGMFTALSDRLDTIEYESAKFSPEGEKDTATQRIANKVNAMMANSARWLDATPAERLMLENDNQTLGASIGAKYDDASGTWRTPAGNNLYSLFADAESSQSIVQKMASNASAWHSATAEQKITLETENQKLGASIGARYDDTSGTWQSAGGLNLFNGYTTPSSAKVINLDAPQPQTAKATPTASKTTAPTPTQKSGSTTTTGGTKLNYTTLPNGLKKWTVG